MRKDFFTPPRREEGMEAEGEKAAVNRGEGRRAKEGMERERERERRVGACAVRNADPFPRWPLWAISLPAAGPKNHNAPCLSPTQCILVCINLTNDGDVSHETFTPHPSLSRERTRSFYRS